MYGPQDPGAASSAPECSLEVNVLPILVRLVIDPNTRCGHGRPRNGGRGAGRCIIMLGGDSLVILLKLPSTGHPNEHCPRGSSSLMTFHFYHFHNLSLGPFTPRLRGVFYIIYAD